MATTTSLGTRRSEAQRHALAGVEREIRVADPSSRRKYLRDFGQAFRSYESVLNLEEVRRLAATADIVLIGDYHALPACQRYAASLLEERAHPGDRPIVLGVEAIFSRDQHILDEWWRREIDEAELRRRIRFDVDWGYDWPPFYELLVTAREHAEAIYGLDCMPRGDLRRAPLHDRHAAEKIQEIGRRHPDAVVMVLFGESHLAPGHLPRLLRESLSQKKLLTVLQNVDELYWQTAGESCENIEAVRVSDAVVCVFNSTPLEKYENYRLCLERWKENDPDSLDLSSTVYNLVNSLARFIGINQYAAHNGTQPRFLVDMLPEVYCHPPDAHLLKVVAARDDERDLLNRLENGGCAYVPACNILYVREFRMVHAAEEVARFLRHACMGLPGLSGRGSREAKDASYDGTLENCLAYFGSQILCPSRVEGKESGPVEPAATLERLLLRSYVPRGNPAARDAGHRQLGYALGGELYDAYLGGRVSKSFLRSIFMSGPGSSQNACRSVIRKVRFPKTKRARR